VERIQVIQESVHEVSILVVAVPGYCDEDEAHLLRNARRRLPQSMRVVVHRTKQLERTALGKTPFVIHRAAVKALLQAPQAASGQA
jgi:hypothetical protein